MALTLTPVQGLPIFKQGDNLSATIFILLAENGIILQDGDILVIAQKIVSKVEGRFVNLESVRPSSLALAYQPIVQKDPRLIELILRESNSVLRIRQGVIIVEHKMGFICANAGIDHSNVTNPSDDGEYVLLLPENPDVSAQHIRKELHENCAKSIGILIIDSHGRTWRNGTVGVAIGVSGLPALTDLRGTKDLFGRVLQITQVATADELAAAASLVMGQAGEGTPVIHVRGFPYPLRESGLSELLRPKTQDLFR